MFSKSHFLRVRNPGTTKLGPLAHKSTVEVLTGSVVVAWLA